MKKTVILLLCCSILGTSGCGQYASKRDVNAWSKDMDRWVMAYRAYDHQEQRYDELAMCQVASILGEIADKTMNPTEATSIKVKLSKVTEFCPPTDTPDGPPPPCKFGSCEGT